MSLRWRTATVAVVVAAMVAVVAGCSSPSDERSGSGADGSDPSETATSSQSSTTESPTTTVVAVVLEEEQRRLRDDIVGSIERLLAHPGVEVTYESLDLDGAQVQGTARIDQTTGDYSSTETIRPEINPELEILSERVLIGSTLFARFTGPADEPDTVEWGSSVIDDDVFLSETRSVAYTALGGAGGGLERLVQLLDNVEWSAETASNTNVDGRLIDSVLVGFDSEAVGTYLRTAGLERTVFVEHGEQTLYEFWIDAATGELVQLLAAGVQFQDGEPIEGAAIEIAYEPVESISIEAPTS